MEFTSNGGLGGGGGHYIEGENVIDYLINDISCFTHISIFL